MGLIIFRLIPMKLFLYDHVSLQKQLFHISSLSFKGIIIATINRPTRSCQKLSAYHIVYSSPQPRGRYYYLIADEGTELGKA